MSLKRIAGNSGRLVEVSYQSKILAGNPLDDPADRRFPVWLPPGYDNNKKRFSVLYDLVGYSGAGQSHTNWRGFDENVPERAARLIHENKMSGCIIVFPNCFTALGGNQYINSSAIGNYADYLTQEIIPFIDNEFRTYPSRESRGLFGKSSGGYGAIIHGMKYTKYWGAIANHSGDCYFDFIYRSDWPNTLTQLSRFKSPKSKEGIWKRSRQSKNDGADDGRINSFLNYVWKKNKLDHNEMHCLMNLCMAATYDPDESVKNGFRVPFDFETGEIISKRWKKWLDNDPIRLIKRYKKNLNSLRGIYMDCGWRDQYHIHYGMRILSTEMRNLGIKHRYNEFDGTHSGIDSRMDISLPFLQKSLRG
ncbi:MAG: alpha/beta hydrolase-fold protein [Pseudomonadota bacterium]|nr:alpha/beta hydrolase-fold protein [Pseudomonadota bacterium]